MAATPISLLQGEKRPLYVSESAATGTLTITSAPTITLYDRHNQIVTGYNGIAVTNYTSGAAATIQAYHDLDTAALAPGAYYAVIALPVTASDNIPRVMKADFTLYIRAVPPQ